MKKIVYVVTDRNRAALHVGMSADLKKTLDFYQKMPHLFFDNSQQYTRLVYFEEYRTEEQALGRFKQISRFTRTQKERLVRSCNPDWIDLTKGLDFESMYMRPRVKNQPLLPFAV